jgi:hypothetical protein
MLQVLIIVRDANGNVIPNASVSVLGVTGQTDSSGTVTLSVNGTSGQSVSVTASAAGFNTASQSLTLSVYAAILTISLTSSTTPLTVTMTVTDGTNPIVGAEVFLNGSSAPDTDTAGSTTLTLSTSTNQLSINATGYAPYSASFSSSGVPDFITLTAQTSAGQNLTLVSSPPASTLQIGSEGGLLGSDGTYVTTQAYQPGSYDVTLTSNGQNSTTTISVVAGQSLYNLIPVSVTDSGSGASLQTISPAGAAAPTSSSPGTVATTNQAQTSSGLGSNTTPVNSTSTNVPDYEFVNPSTNFGRYFTATQARMYIGNLFIEELAGCQFVLQGNQVPIYGYASESFDAIGSGKYLVQGQLMVHFISEGYLYTVLSEFKRLNGNTTSASLTQFQNLLASQQTLQASNAASTATGQAQIAALQQQRQSLLASDPTLASAVKRTTLTNSTTAVGPNAVYRKTPFDIVIELEGGGRTVTRKITNCVLTSNEQIMGDADSPLLDSYGFIGRRLH